MGHHLADGAPVGHHETVEAPLPLQDGPLQVHAPGGGDATDLVEGVHEGRDPGIRRRLEGREHDVAEGVLRDVDGVVVATALGEAIGRIVLGARRDRVEIAQGRTLEAPDPGHGDLRTQERILPGALHDPPPARIAADVEHGGEGPVQTGGRRLDSGHPSRGLDGLQVPARGLGQGHREHRPVAVDHVVPEEQRDPQPGVLHRQLLGGASGLGPDDIQHRAHQAGPDVLEALLCAAFFRRRTGDVVEARVLVHLADLLVQRHLPQQLVDASLDLGAGQRLRGYRHGETHGQNRSERKEERRMALHGPHSSRFHPGTREAGQSGAGVASSSRAPITRRRSSSGGCEW